MKRLMLPAAIGILMAAGCGTDGDDPVADPPAPPANPGATPGTNTALSPSVIAQMEALVQDKAARTPAQRKISSSLLYAKNQTFAQARAQLDPALQITNLQSTDDAGRVLVDVRADMAKVGGKIDALGGKIVDAGADHARAWLALDQLEPLATEAAVTAIRPALRAATARMDTPGSSSRFQTTPEQRLAAVQAAQAAWTKRTELGQFTPSAGPQGSVIGLGDTAHAALRARRFYGADGTGVKVGVLSDSDDLKERSIALGDLPANTVTIPGQDGRPGGGEGTAMMEIVHDVAPGAQLFFATAFTSPESFADNIRRLRFEYHCDIIIDDIIYFFESPFADDIIAQAVEDVSADGALYFSSAGNEGNFDDGTTGTWEGDFVPQGSLPALPSGYTVHSFGSGVISNRIEAGGGPAVLHWADPATLDHPTSGNDYDLFVLDPDLRTVLFASTDIQDGDDLAFEIIGFNLPAGAQIVIAASPGAEPRAIRTAVFRGQLAIGTGGATYGHSAAASAISVAAVSAAKAGTGEFTAGRTTPVELFSADGPRRVFFDRNGLPTNPAIPGQTFASRGGVTRAKPDLAAADGVATTLPSDSGLNPFFGTSAAAPHAGAIAALAKSAVPTKTPAQLRSAMIAGTLDIEATGADRDSGRGLLSAFDMLTRAGASPKVTLATGAVTLTPLGSTALNPGGVAQLGFQITNLGGAPATGVSVTLTSSSPDVIILQASSSYGNLAPGATSTTNPLFAFFVGRNLPCGATVPVTATVNYTGSGPHPVAFDFRFPTGHADQFSHYAYTGEPQPIPEGTPEGIALPLDVSGFTGTVAGIRFNIGGEACNTDEGSTTVGIDHTWVGDVTLALTSPSGQTVTLFSGPGGTGNGGNNFCQTVLDDAATTSIQSFTALAPFTGTFSPLEPLSSFAGEDPNGTWTVRVIDDFIVDTGSVRAFSLDVARFTCD